MHISMLQEQAQNLSGLLLGPFVLLFEHAVKGVGIC